VTADPASTTALAEAPVVIDLDGRLDGRLDWRPAWESAQDLWGVRLHDPQFVVRKGAHRETRIVAFPDRVAPKVTSVTSEDTAKNTVNELGKRFFQRSPSFAWFSFPPQVTIDVAKLAAAGVSEELETIFAHEIGHHVRSPATRIDKAKIDHQVTRALVVSGTWPNAELTALVANLWSDQLINVRLAALQRRRDPTAEPGIVRVWRRLSAGRTADGLWWVILRAYEIAWALAPGTLCPATAPPMPTILDELYPQPSDDTANEKLRAAQAEVAAARAQLFERIAGHAEIDAVVLARLVDVFGDDPVTGALSFAMLMAPYLPRSADAPEYGRPGCGGQEGGVPLTAAELGAVLRDPRLAIDPAAAVARALADVVGGGGPESAQPTDQPGAAGAGQSLSIANTQALYHNVDPNTVAAAWYRTAARRWVKPLTQYAAAPAGEELPGPLEQWEPGDDLADLDWAATLAGGAQVVPGVTTRRRSLLDDPNPHATASVRLDIYIDSSGSMPTPYAGSPAVLAGTILALSVLRGGGLVRVTSWSGPGQVAGDTRFQRDPDAVIRDLTTFYASSTSFPLDLLDVRYGRLPPASHEAKRHLVVLSDDGLTSMFGAGNEPYAQVAAQVRPKLTTATLVLMDPQRTVASLAEAAGYDIVYLESMNDAPAACARLAKRIRDA
jgi:hypothetical protein